MNRNSMMHFASDRWLLGAGGLIALLVVSLVLNLQNTRRLNDDAGSVAHTHEVMDTFEEVHGHLREAEAVQRTHLIVGDDTPPAAFDDNINAAKQKLDQARTLTADNPMQQARIAEIQERVETLASFWTRTMNVRTAQGFDAARQIVASGQSRSMMAELQTQVRQMDEMERGLLRERSDKRQQTYRAALVTGLITGVGAVAGTGAFMVLLHRHLASRTADAAMIAEQAERMRTTLASIGDAVITTDIEGRITNVNAVAESLIGWTKQQAIGQPLGVVFRIVNEQTRMSVENPAARALCDGIIVGLANHTILIARDGTERPIDDSAAPIRCQDGQVVGCVLVFRDVTQRRRLEKENASRLAAARLLSAIVESSEDAIVSKTLDGIIQSWNAAAERLFGFTAEQAVGQHISLIIPDDRRAEEEQIIARLRDGHRIEHYETVRLHKDGQAVVVSLTISPIKDEDGRIIGASKIARDITERKRAEADRQRFVTVVENSTDFIGMYDLQGVPFFVNRAGLRMVGLDSIEQARTVSVRDFFFPEDQSRIIADFFPSVLRSGHGEIDIRFRHFRTGEALWMAYKVLTLTDDAGQQIALATVSQDVTERRRLEDNLRRLAADLSEANHRKDEFLATLSHELRNPLAPIRNALQVIRMSREPEDHEQAHAMMQRQLEQMVRLIDDLLDMSRITRGTLALRREPVQLSAAINSAIETSRPMIDNMNHKLTVSLPQQPIIVDADLTRLAQVFSNLLNNSAKYMDRGGQIWITAERMGSDVIVSVKDAGIGIAADQLAHIFEMFSQVDRSLERSQGGLGIGLTLVRRLVEMHGGRIEAKSGGLGKGAEFIVRLPIAVEATGQQPASHAEEARSAKSSLRILIVDDNRDSADSLAILLQLMGHETRTAYDGEDGVNVAETFRPDVMLLDIGLPNLNGYEACRRIREQSWGKQVMLIAVTGWGQEQDRRRSHEAGFNNHMVKPVDPQELMKLLAEIQPAA